MKRVLLLILLTVPFWSFSQTEEPLPPEGDDSVTIYFAEQGSRTQFSAGLRSLRQIAGAPEAFYTYYWEFGDGTFSFDEMPVHDYSSAGEYEVRLYATNNYDDGKAPPSRAKKYRKEKAPAGNAGEPIPAGQATEGKSSAGRKAPSGHFLNDQDLMLKTKRMPRPEEEMVLIAGYRNLYASNMPLNGTLVLFFNETAFKNDNFEVIDIRTWNEEEEVPWSSLLAQSGMTAYVPAPQSGVFRTDLYTPPLGSGMPFLASAGKGLVTYSPLPAHDEIGRASCRERVCQA